MEVVVEKLEKNTVLMAQNSRSELNGKSCGSKEVEEWRR